MPQFDEGGPIADPNWETRVSAKTVLSSGCPVTVDKDTATLLVHKVG